MSYTIVNNVTSVARQLGLSDGTNDEIATRIASLVRQSAPVTHPHGNRRFEDWIFNVKKQNMVTHIHLIQCETCDDKKRVDVHDVCAHCDGEGCKWCRGKGYFINMIPCPECTGN